MVDVDFTPTDELQIVAWVEKADGTFIDTIYITNKTGLYGLGNRPGRYDLNSGPQTHDMAPYGRRENVFPVWAHRHGKTWQKVVFQNGDENDVSHPAGDSTPENNPPYCRPISPSDPGDKPFWDTGTCATPNVFTDKGTLSGSATSLYPPRADINYQCNDNDCDSPSVRMYKSLNPFDAITQATPTGGMQTEVSWAVPSDLPAGDYVMWLEVSKAFDFNDTYNASTYPAPTVVYGSYGAPYRGQPSIVYSTAFTLTDAKTVTTSQTFVGYGDPTGATGVLNPPDATITTDTPGSGASRLQILAGSSADLMSVCARVEPVSIPPTPVTGLDVMAVTSSSATLQFVAPSSSLTSCTGAASKVAGYEIRYRADQAMTPDNFADSSLAAVSIVPQAAGGMQTFEVDGLLPMTSYWIGVRAYDDCRNYSDLAVLPITTTDRQSGEVDACFIATAAYGSLLANDVEMLRTFRDSVLRSTALGEIAVETYYTFGPSVAGVVGESDLLRATARAALAPVVATVRHGRFE